MLFRRVSYIQRKTNMESYLGGSIWPEEMVVFSCNGRKTQSCVDVPVVLVQLSSLDTGVRRLPSSSQQVNLLGKGSSCKLQIIKSY